MLYRLRPAALAAVFALVALPLAATAGPSVPAEPVSVPAEQVSLRRGIDVGGLWCGAGLLREFTLEIAQQYQNVEAKLVRKGRVREITGHVEGAMVKTDPQRNETMELLAQGDELRIIAATGVLALTTGQFFTRAAGGSCTH
jgi:hypothetical protein